MKFYLPKAGKSIVKLMLTILTIFAVRSNINNKEIIAVDNNGNKAIELMYHYVNYETIYRNNYNIPLFTQKKVINGEQGIVATSGESSNTFSIREPKDEVIEVGKGKINSFVGSLTGYGPDCVGCGGRVSCNGEDGKRQDVRNGNIYYFDSEYGQLRIIAADKSIPCGTIIEIQNFIFSSGPIKAIVLDRGGAIKGKKIDLLYSSEKETGGIGLQSDITFNILRWDWSK